MFSEINMDEFRKSMGFDIADEFEYLARLAIALKSTRKNSTELCDEGY